MNQSKLISIKMVNHIKSHISQQNKTIFLKLNSHMDNPLYPHNMQNTNLLKSSLTYLDQRHSVCYPITHSISLS